MVDMFGNHDDGFSVELARRVVAGFAEAHPGKRISQLGPVDEVAGRVLSALETATASPWADAVGPVYPTAVVREMLGGITRQALLDRVKRHKLLSLRTADGHLVWPAWQFRHASAIAGLSEVLAAVAPGGADPWTLASWLRAPQPTVEGRSVADLISSGDQADLAAAVSLARAAPYRWRAAS